MNLEAGCTVDTDCRSLAEKTYAQMSAGPYSRNCSLMAVPESFDVYLAAHRTARKRALRCARLGYTFATIDRCEHVDAIYQINTSLPERQGRPMSAGYLERTEFSSLPEYPCARHRISVYGVTDSDGELVAYTVIHRVGELVMVSQILGHGEHLDAGVMHLLMTETVRAQIAAGPGEIFYNRHDSGGPGLVWFKERLGFAAHDIEWTLQ